MSPLIRARLFEPFFTTKEQGKGTGLGLAGVYGIVKQNRGNIGVYSEPGLGTTFHIYLPRVDADLAVAPAPLAVDEAPMPTRTVLVVDDHPALQTLTARVLQKAGFAVLVAESPAVALDVARQHPGPLDLLVTDVVMPGHSGPWLATQLRQERPGLRILHMSGYTHDAMLRHGLVEGAVTSSRSRLPLRRWCEKCARRSRRRPPHRP